PLGRGRPGACSSLGWSLNERLLRLGKLLVELLAKPPHLLRRQAIDAAQEVVEIGMGHGSILAWIECHLGQDLLPLLVPLLGAVGLDPGIALAGCHPSICPSLPPREARSFPQVEPHEAGSVLLHEIAPPAVKLLKSLLRRVLLLLVVAGGIQLLVRLLNR